MPVLGLGTAQADPLPKIERTFENGGVLRFYGQINKGFLNYDDGQETESYDFIDNNNSNTRFGLTYKQSFAETWEYLGTIEIQYAPYSTTNINILNPSPPAGAYELGNGNIRKIDNQFTHERLGVFSIGQGNMASQDTAEVDLSGTTVITKSAVQESAGAQFVPADGRHAQQDPGQERLHQLQRPRAQGSPALRHARVRRVQPAHLVRARPAV